MLRALLLSVTLLAPAAHAATYLSTGDFAEDWRISKAFTVAVADKMPAEFYDFKATPEEMSFGEQMVHIGQALFERFSQVSRDPIPPPATPKAVTKTEVLAYLGHAFDYVLQVLPNITDQQLDGAKFKVDFEGRPSPIINGREMLRNIYVHTAHHRAQCEVYLRLKGFVPPVYTF